MNVKCNLSGAITLNINRARISSTKCCVPSCNVEFPAELLRIPLGIRYDILKTKRYFIPTLAKACSLHSNYSVWQDMIIQNESCAFTAKQIEEMVDLLRSDPKQSVDMLQVIERNSDAGIKADTGLTREQFRNLFECLRSLRSDLKDNKLASDFLYTYLMKIRTGRTNDDIGRVFGITKMAVGLRLDRVRKALELDFVYKHVNFQLSREELAKHSTVLSQMLFCNGDPTRPVLILDGTYIYIQKSKNFEIQKLSYSDQKKRNFVRVMMCTTADGTIVFALGPYPAAKNDAKVLQSIFESTNAFDNLIAGDVILVDRGFRDCVEFLESRGLNVHMPALLQRSQKNQQLPTIAANRSRLVTANRYGIETRNGHVKRNFKILQKEWLNLTLPKLMIDIRICAALINVYFKSIESNKGYAVEIATRMLERLEVPNQLSTIVFKDNFQKKLIHFEWTNDFEALPHLTEMDLIWISLGKYQINQSVSYCSEHLKANESKFVVYVCPNDVCEIYFADFFSDGKQPKLITTRLKSRFSNKTCNAYVLIDTLGKGEKSVLGYCCTCYNGLRTVGCCSHIMSIIWFTLYIKVPGNMPRAAAFLNNYFHEELSSDSESEA